MATFALVLNLAYLIEGQNKNGSQTLKLNFEYMTHSIKQSYSSLNNDSFKIKCKK